MTIHINQSCIFKTQQEFHQIKVLKCGLLVPNGFTFSLILIVNNAYPCRPVV